MALISNNLPKIPQAPIDAIQAAKTAARQYRQRVETNTLMEGDFERFMARIDAGLLAALTVAASAPPAVQPFVVIEGGRRG